MGASLKENGWACGVELLLRVPPGLAQTYGNVGAAETKGVLQASKANIRRREKVIIAGQLDGVQLYHDGASTTEVEAAAI